MPGTRVWERAALLLGVRRGPAAGLLAMLAFVVAGLLLAHLSQKVLGRPSQRVFDLGVDRGFGEFFSYMQIGWAVLLTAALAVRRRATVFAAWCLVCCYFVVDDGFQIHERAGALVAERLPQGWGEFASPLGELAWMAAIGVVLGTFVTVGHLRAGRRDRAVSAVLVLLFSLLIMVGVVLDAIHHLLLVLLEQRTFRLPLTMLEDGGEILLASVLVAFLFAVTLVGHQPEPRGRLALLVGRAEPEDRQTDR